MPGHRSHVATGRPKGRPSSQIKERARRAVHKALADGRLTKCPCTVCGTVDLVEAHHADYSRPLDVTWLCAQHHAERHGRVLSPEGLASLATTNGRPAKPAADLTEFASVALPPTDTLARAAWAQDIVALNLWRIVHGKADPDTSSAINAAARTIIALVPQERLFQAEDAVRRDGETPDDKAGGGSAESPISDGDTLYGPPPRVGG